MSEQWKSDVTAIFVAVVLAEIVVLLGQALFPWLAERVRVQQDAWSGTSFGMPDQVNPAANPAQDQTVSGG